jgi:methyl coenzyme M reductase beta subunit
MMDELIQAVSRGAGVPTPQATLAVDAMLRFFTARLPSALVGELHVRLRSLASPGIRDGPARTGSDE